MAILIHFVVGTLVMASSCGGVVMVLIWLQVLLLLHNSGVCVFASIMSALLLLCCCNKFLFAIAATSDRLKVNGDGEGVGIGRSNHDGVFVGVSGHEKLTTVSTYINFCDLEGGIFANHVVACNTWE
jgi:hypothetical protein